jgi:hypothetical protein
VIEFPLFGRVLQFCLLDNRKGKYALIATLLNPSATHQVKPDLGMHKKCIYQPLDGMAATRLTQRLLLDDVFVNNNASVQATGKKIRYGELN